MHRGIQHTKGDVALDGPELEKASLGIFYRENKQYIHDISDQFLYNNHQYKGLRVMPEEGHLIYFHNVGGDGMADPTSFHGGEEIAVLSSEHDFDLATVGHKSILVFFKEIPVEKITGVESFASEVQKARSWTKSTYYGEKQV